MPKVTKALRSMKALPCSLLVALACCLATEARADSLVLDPTGDTFGSGAVQLDITSIGAAFNSTALTFTINFAGPIFAPSAFDPRSVVAFIDIDADQNSATGVGSATGLFGPPPEPDLGVDYGIDLSFDVVVPGYVEIFDVVANVSIGIAPVTFTTSALSINVPLALLGGDDGLVNYAVLIGTFDEATDKAPNGVTPATSAPIPEPATLVLLGTGLIGLGAAARRRRSAFRSH